MSADGAARRRRGENRLEIRLGEQRDFVGAPPSRRSARSFTCSADSSPEQYSVVCPAPSSRAATWSSSVDLPMPGSPPTRIIEPGTTPPPRTKSSSSSPVLPSRGARALHVAQLCRDGDAAALGETARAGRCAAPCRSSPTTFGATSSSTSVFHSPHVSQRPCHLEWSAPHSVQR